MRTYGRGRNRRPSRLGSIRAGGQCGEELGLLSAGDMEAETTSGGRVTQEGGQEVGQGLRHAGSAQ